MQSTVEAPLNHQEAAQQQPELKNPELLLEIDPASCVPWHYHNRDLEWLTPANCADLIDSIQRNGQIEPVILRAHAVDGTHPFEIISGARRWFACSQIPNQKLLARIIVANDRECMCLMHAENADSQDISPFERAYSFAVQLKSGAFKNQTDFAQAMGVSQSAVSKMIRTVELFEEPWLAALFKSKRTLSIRHAYNLATLLGKPKLRPRIESEARTILAEHPDMHSEGSALKILQRLIQCVSELTPQKVLPQNQVSFKKNQTLLENKKKPIIILNEDMAGNLWLNVDRAARKFDYDHTSRLCIRAIQDYLRADTE